MQARPNSADGLRQLDRRVLTEIDGTSRLSEETWSMSASR